MRLLIDADIPLFMCSRAVEKDIEWAPMRWSITSDVREAIPLFENWLDTVLDDLELTRDEVVMCMSDTDNWRKELEISYKSDRVGSLKPCGYWGLREWVREEYYTIIKKRLEADDVLGIEATKPKAGETIIVSDDKDLKTIPGRLYIPRKQQLLEISPREATMHHLSQALGGDPTDGYPGCPGIGVERAYAALDNLKKQVPYGHTFQRGEKSGQTETRWREEEAESFWEVVMSFFEKAGLKKKDAILQCRMARILQHGEYVERTHKVKLWTPRRMSCDA